MNNTKLEKKLCYALRHKPEAFDLVLDEEGFADAENVCKAFDIDMNTLDQIVEQSDKKRFELRDGKIRALYGHSIPTKIKKEKLMPPKCLYHGTSRKAAKMILTDGLKSMKRQYVHLSYDVETAYEVGKRKDSHPVTLLIDARKAYEEGIVFYIGNERNILADYIPSKYIKRLDENTIRIINNSIFVNGFNDKHKDPMNNQTNEEKSSESPYKGIFWIVDRKNLEKNEAFLFKIESDREGNVLHAEYELTSNKGDNYNHKNTWNLLPKALTHNKPYNYYPRGRVEIKKDTAKIFINPLLNEDEILEYIEKEYNLNHGTISYLKIIIDNSKHYQSN